MKTNHYGYAVEQLEVPEAKPKQAPVAPAQAATYGYASDQRTASDRAAPTSVNTKNKGKPGVPKAAASVGYSNS